MDSSFQSPALVTDSYRTHIWSNSGPSWGLLWKFPRRVETKVSILPLSPACLGGESFGGELVDRGPAALAGFPFLVGFAGTKPVQDRLTPKTFEGVGKSAPQERELI
jgi:hypothetical protein